MSLISEMVQDRNKLPIYQLILTPIATLQISLKTLM